MSEKQVTSQFFQISILRNHSGCSDSFYFGAHEEVLVHFRSGGQLQESSVSSESSLASWLFKDLACCRAVLSSAWRNFLHLLALPAEDLANLSFVFLLGLPLPSAPGAAPPKKKFWLCPRVALIWRVRPGPARQTSIKNVQTPETNPKRAVHKCFRVFLSFFLVLRAPLLRERDTEQYA